ncbi:MAG: mechanosensitive ion channel [Candidatus Babeliaceae bacterium]|nr:mechanosensitive ion channel [Candidatus Babeliaceae bacterium]
MKKIIVLFSLFLSSRINSLAFDTIARVFTPHKAQANTTTVSNEKHLKDLQELINQLNVTAYKKDFEEVSADTQVLNERLMHVTHSHEKEILTKEISSLNQLLQLVVDRDAVVQQLKSLYDEMKKVFDGIASDPHFTKFKLDERASYSYEDLTGLNQKIIDSKNRQTELKSNVQKLQADATRYSKEIEQLQAEIKEKTKQQKSYIEQSQTNLIDGELLDIQGKILVQRKDLASLKLKEAENRLILANVQLHVTKSQLEILEREYKRVKRATVIPSKDIKKADIALEEKRIQSNAERDKLRQEKLEYLVQIQNQVKMKIGEVVAQYNISASDLEALRNWNFQPKTVTQWLILSTIDPFLAKDSYAETAKEYIQAMIDYLKAELKRETIEVEIKKSWYKFMSRKFRSDNDRYIDDSIKYYESTKNELSAQLRTVSDSRDRVISSLGRLNKSLESLKALMESLKEQQRALFKDNEVTFLECQKSLKETEEYIRQKIDTTTKLIEKYQATVTVIDDSLKRASSMLSELTTKGFWKRSEQSIEWSQIKNILPDLQRFAYDVYITGVEYFTLSHVTQVFNSMIDYLKDPLYLLMFIINAILVCIIYILLRLFLPDLYQFLHAGTAGSGFLIYLRLWASLCIKFILMHMNSFFIWGFLYLLVLGNIIHDTYLSLLIELLSIPYLLYIVYEFIYFIMAENHYRNYSIISQSYERRFYIVISVVLSSLVVLYFLRGAILLDYNALTSDLPTILLALMFIVIQIGLIYLLFGKKQVLMHIPDNTPMWLWVKEHLEKYYYIFLLAVVAVIVMSNPYVGYGQQVLYILSRVFLTLLIIPFFLWIHSRLKTSSSNLFFYYEEGENMRERFGSGRLWYGIFIIASFVVFVIGLVFALGSIWGYGITFSDIGDFLNRELTAVKDDAGREISVTLYSLLQIVLFVLGGIFLNYVINQFVLKRVFDPFLVGVGVQNTISAFTKYAIILLAVFIGLSNAGLEGLTTKFAIIIGGLSFALQEPLRDFFSYFIILVQRPVKIGDLIQISDEVIGIVRHITPRSVIIRRRNSVTVIVPNSQIILNAVTNWNYSRSYFAFNDIMITVSYAKDPQQVKNIILSVLHDNYTILKSPAPIVWLHDFVDNGYQFLVRGYLTADKVLEQWEISSLVRIEIVKKLRENGIEIASPTRLIRVAAQSESDDQIMQKLS